MPDLDAPWASREEAATILGVSIATIDRMLASGRLTREKYGEGRQGTVRIPMSELLPSRAPGVATVDTDEFTDSTEGDD
jgi:excisionase family DNA binding protein